MYGGEAPYGQHQPPSGGHASHQPASGGYGYAAPQQQQANYGYAPAAAAAPAPAAVGYGGAPSAYGGYDPAYGTNNPGMGGAEAAGGYGGRPYGAAGHVDGGRGDGGGGGGPRFAAVRLRGLPFGVREYEVAMFLGVDPIDILLTSRHGRATGEAYVVLSHPAELDIAMRKNKAYMGSRYIEVFEARKSDYYRAVADVVIEVESGSYGRYSGGRGGGGGRGRSPRDRSRSPLSRGGRDRGDRGGGGGGEAHAYRGGEGGGSAKDHGPITSRIVKLRGLPFSAGRDEIINFFDDPSLGLPVLSMDKVLIATAGDGRVTGQAFVEFESPEQVEIALRKDRQMMGTRYIELFVSSEDERARFLAPGEEGR
ncbi:hypothetical protein Ndes2437B_g06688 [Nannochloris sp. 'desiccata']|nr:hypothetical protein KSW81_003966 [Chlorella desiccata (nom. nud.)]